MVQLKSYLAGRWMAGSGSPQTLLNPATEEPLATASSEGLDLRAALDYARSKGGPALRELSQRIWALRAAEAAKAAAPAPTNAALLAATRGRPQLRWIDRARSV